MKPLKEKLLKYFPNNFYEKDCKERMLAFLEKHPDCFLRSCLTGHFTASAWVLNPSKTHVLLLHHKKLGDWFQLGGHCDGDPDVLAVAIKEAQEESGILDIVPLSEDIFDIDIHTIPPYHENLQHEHLDIRFLLMANTEKFTQNDESHALRWFHKDDQGFPSSVKRMVDKWRLF